MIQFVHIPSPCNIGHSCQLSSHVAQPGIRLLTLLSFFFELFVVDTNAQCDCPHAMHIVRDNKGQWKEEILWIYAYMSLVQAELDLYRRQNIVNVLAAAQNDGHNFRSRIYTIPLQKMRQMCVEYIRVSLPCCFLSFSLLSYHHYYIIITFFQSSFFYIQVSTFY